MSTFLFPATAGLHVYAENKPGHDPAYVIGEDDIHAALSGVAAPLTITTAFSDAPNPDALREADIFIGSVFDAASLGRRAPRVKIIHSTSAGVDRYLPLDWIPEGAVFTNSSGIHADKAGEYGLMALLMLNDHMPQHMTSQRQRQWRQTLSTPIKGKRVLIYGLGALGGAIAKAVKPLGVEVWGIQRTPRARESVDAVFAPDRLAELLPQVDFLVVSCPLTAATRGLFGAREIALLKPSAGILNIARAAVFDYEALAAALTAGRIAGAVLDVFAQEPLPPDAPWWDVPNLIVTPHVSADDPIGYVRRALEILAENIGRAQSGRALRNVVQKDREY